MGSNLDKPVNNLPEEAYTYTQEVFQCDEQKLMVKKGVYSYDWMDSFNKFTDKELTQKEEFYSILNDEHISDEAYRSMRKTSGEHSTWSIRVGTTTYTSNQMYCCWLYVLENFRKT